MALLFPDAALIAPLALRDGFLEPMWRQETSTSAGGVSVVKDLGPMLWRAYYQAVPMKRAEAMDLETDLMRLRGGINLFEGYDPRREQPKAAGSEALTGVTVQAISADRTALQLAGLPADFVMSKSDYLSVDDGVNMNLLRVASGAVADGAGVSGWIDVLPFLRPAVAVGQGVTLRLPCARFMVQQDSIARQREGLLHDVVSFSAIEVIT